ncbi:hypothetical protein ACFL6H_04720 [Candidatus Latescibacterota bacterium]
MDTSCSRRSFISRTGAAALTSIVAKNASAQKHTWEGFVTDFEPHTTPFMNQYYDGIMDIAYGIRDTQIENIAEAMEEAYRRKRNGGRLYSNHQFGHTPVYALNKDRPGQPWLLPLHDAGMMRKKEYDALKPGDFVLSFRNNSDGSELDARNRGVYIVGVTNSYFRFKGTPPGGLANMHTAVEDYANIVIDSQVPWDNGLVAPPALDFRVCPSTSTAGFLVYWACTASLANLIATNGKGSSSEPAKQYLDLASERFEMIGTDLPKIDYVTEKWADRVLEDKARILIYGKPQTERNGNEFVDEATGASAAEGVRPYRELKDPSSELRKEDIVLIGAFSSDNYLEIDVARQARKKGALSVAFCPYQTEDDSPDVRLFREVDYSFNTYSGERNGVITVPGFNDKICPLTGVTGNMVHWLLTAQWADHMARRGETPYFRWGRCYGGAEYLDTIVIPNTKIRGY